MPRQSTLGNYFTKRSLAPPSIPKKPSPQVQTSSSSPKMIPDSAIEICKEERKQVDVEVMDDGDEQNKQSVQQKKRRLQQDRLDEKDDETEEYEGQQKLNMDHMLDKTAGNSTQIKGKRRKCKLVTSDDDSDVDDNDKGSENEHNKIDPQSDPKKNKMSDHKDNALEKLSSPQNNQQKIHLQKRNQNANVSFRNMKQNPASMSDSGSTKVRVSDINKQTKGKPLDCKATKVATTSDSESVLVSGSGSNDQEKNTIASVELKSSSPVPYKVLADVFAQVEAITGRIEISTKITEMFRCIMKNSSKDLLPAIYLTSNKLAPSHEGLEIGVGESIILKALAATTGRNPARIKQDYVKLGDLGDVAMECRATQKTLFASPPLTVGKVFSELKIIANTAGNKSQNEKLLRIQKLLTASKGYEARYLIRALQGKLRIHLAEKTVIGALAAAFVLENASPDLLKTEEQKENEIKRATQILNAVYCQLPVWDLIVPALFSLKTIDDRLLQQCKLTPGIPVGPMLAKPTKGISEVLDKFSDQPFTCEFKYDGERAQIHKLQDGSIKIYSRNAEDNTAKFPDILNNLPKAINEEYKNASFVIDSEAVAFDKESGKILPFQELQGRGRKDVKLDEIKVHVCIFAFDLLYLNGESCLQKPLRERRQLLTQLLKEVDGVLKFATGRDLTDTEDILTFLNESVASGCEGLMVKGLDGESSTYEPANRSQNWLKVKKDYLEGVGDTLDLVPIAGYYGRGKRTGVFGAFLLACYDPENEEFQSICKIGTGLSDANLSEFSEYFSKENRTLTKAKPYYKSDLVPDVWFEPCMVWEILCADLTISPKHQAAKGLVDPEKGVALRFPRLVRIREDKEPEAATTAQQVADMYSNQASLKI